MPATAPSASGRPAAPASTSPRLLLAGEVVVLLAVATFLLRGAVGQAVGSGVDVYGTLWFHEWLASCLRDGVDPSFTPAFFHPFGKDLFAHTGANFLDALLAVPFLLIFGSPNHLVPFTALLLLGNALAMRALLGSLRLGRTAAFAGSLLYMVSPFVIDELSRGRPTQAMLWFWPLALRSILRSFEDPAWRHPVLGGLFVALQAWTYWFTGHFFVLVFAIPLVVEAARRGLPALLRLGIAGSVALIAVSPAVVPMLLAIAGGQVPGVDGGMEGAPDTFGAGGAVGLPGYRLQQLLVVAVALVAARHRRLWAVAALLGVLLALGPTLPGGIPNPLWWVGSFLPGFGRLLFRERALAAVSLAVAVAVAEGIDRVPERTRWLAAGAVVLLGGTWGGMRLSPFHPSPIHRPAYVADVREAPGVVLDLPFLCSGMVVHYQPMHGQPLVGGMGEQIDAMRPAGVEERVQADPVLHWISRTSRGDFADPPDFALPEDVRWVVLHLDLYGALPGTCWEGSAIRARGDRVRDRLSRYLGRPHVSDRHAVAWDLTRVRAARR